MEHVVFVVEDSEVTRRLFQMTLESAGFSVRSFRQAEAFLAVLETTEPSAICLDVFLPGMSGIEALPRIRRRRPQVPVIMITSETDAKVGVQAMKSGAADYLVKPVDLEVLEQTVRAAVSKFELVLEIRRLRAEALASNRLSEILGRSPGMDRVATQIGLILQNDISVYLRGETGTGKDLIARTIHAHSRRANGPFVAVNCGAIPRDLQESQFFGHERGAFTGAVQRHRGYFEEADNGTIFLDEVAELSPAAQVQLLRALQEREVRRIGAEQVIPVNVRVISASNRDLKAMATAGEFREDLLYRLVVFTIPIPPLRERPEDIPLLVGHFLRLYCEQMDLPAPELTDEALACLMAYSWPGNVRELQNTIQVALIASQGDPIRSEHLPPAFQHLPKPTGSVPQGQAISLVDPLTGKPRPLDDIELEVMIRAREMAGGNIARAAEMLGIGRATLYRRLGAVDKGESTAHETA